MLHCVPRLHTTTAAVSISRSDQLNPPRVVALDGPSPALVLRWLQHHKMRSGQKGGSSVPVIRHFRQKTYIAIHGVCLSELGDWVEIVGIDLPRLSAIGQFLAIGSSDCSRPLERNE